MSVYITRKVLQNQNLTSTSYSAKIRNLFRKGISYLKINGPIAGTLRTCVAFKGKFRSGLLLGDFGHIQIPGHS